MRLPAQRMLTTTANIPIHPYRTLQPSNDQKTKRIYSPRGCSPLSTRSTRTLDLTWFSQDLWAIQISARTSICNRLEKGLGWKQKQQHISESVCTKKIWGDLSENLPTPRIFMPETQAYSMKNISPIPLAKKSSPKELSEKTVSPISHTITESTATYIIPKIKRTLDLWQKRLKLRKILQNTQSQYRKELMPMSIATSK